MNSLDLLNDLFPGTLTLTVPQVAQACGRKPKQIYAVLSGPTPPWKPLRIGGCVVVSKISVADWLDGKTPDDTATAKTPTATVEPPKKKRGRPRKALSAILFHQALVGEITAGLLLDVIGAALPKLRDGIAPDDANAKVAVDALAGTMEAIKAASEARAMADAFAHIPAAPARVLEDF